MTGDLIDGARLESGRLELRIAAQELRGIVADVVDLYRAASPDRDLQLSMPEAPLVVDGDATRLSQLLGNLLTNAIKYLPAGSTVGVEVRREAGNAAIAVTNSGPGIVVEEQAHVFEPFRRGGGTPTVPGVGLFVAQRIAQVHGGRLRFVSQPGARTTFTLELPLAEAVAERAVGPDHRPEETPA